MILQLAAIWLLLGVAAGIVFGAILIFDWVQRLHLHRRADRQLAHHLGEVDFWKAAR